MTITVGNLLTDPSAQSFISVADADEYLGLEQNEAWNLAPNAILEAALVLASRWLVDTYRSRFYPLDADGLLRIGRVAARLASESLRGKLHLYEGVQTEKLVKSLKAGSVEVTYQDAMSADAAGRAWPWLEGMLAGLVRGRGLGIGVMVV